VRRYSRAEKKQSVDVLGFGGEEGCTLLRNPHIAGNEELQLRPYVKPENMRKYFLKQLDETVMINWDTLTAERLGGADFDGDMVKIITDGTVNRCVRRNYDGEVTTANNIPLLKIPSAEPIISDANDWKARFETVRFTFDMLKNFEGLQRVLTIIARGYLHSGGDPYDNVDLARRALCAWCSITETKKSAPDKEWKFRTNFGEYQNDFPELVTKDGRGWFYRHVHKVISFVEKQDEKSKASKPAKDHAEQLSSGFDGRWRKKVIQYQVPIFSPGTKGRWTLRFDDIIGDALVQGKLKDKTFSFSSDQEERIKAELPKNLPYRVAKTVLAYTIANKPDDSDWTVLPITNFDAYFGTTSLIRRLIGMIPESLFIRERSDTCGVSRGRVRI